jgi:hypothetical protein
MDKKLTHSLEVNGLIVEIYNEKPEENFWGDKRIYIYDCISDLTEVERDMIINYLYEEGFIDDRRTKCDVIRGEDFF